MIFGYKEKLKKENEMVSPLWGCKWNNPGPADMPVLFQKGNKKGLFLIPLEPYILVTLKGNAKKGRTNLIFSWQ